MKPPGFGDEGQGRVQFKDKNNATLFVFKEKEQSWLCLAGPPSSSQVEIVPWGFPWPSSQLGFPSPLQGNPHFSFWPSIFKPCADFQAPKGESLNFFDIFYVKVERDWRLLCGTRATHDLPTCLIAPITFIFPPWNDLFYRANCFRVLIFQKSCE